MTARRASKRASKPEPAAPAAKLPPYRALPVSELVAFPGNPRTHSAEQVGKIAASIVEFGFTNPILIAGRKGIIAGHGRLLAAQKLGLAVVVAHDRATRPQRRSEAGADNPSLRFGEVL